MLRDQAREEIRRMASSAVSQEPIDEDSAEAPVEREALRLALDKLSAKLRSEGKKPSDYKNLKEVAAALVERNSAFMERAKEIIAARDAMAVDLESTFFSLKEKEPDEQAEAAR
jgi:hypothetical protein